MYQKDYVVKQDMGNRIWCEPYVVQKDDSLTQVFQGKGGLIDENPEEFIRIFKRLNPQVSDLESIRPGQRIYIPLKKMGRERELTSRIFTLPMVTISADKTKPEAEPMPHSDNTGFTEYKIKPGDTLLGIFHQYFGILDTVLSGERLRMFQKNNPEITDINRIYPGRTIRMPQLDAEAGAKAAPEDRKGPLERVAAQFHANLTQEGDCFFPVPGSADYRLNFAQFPLMELPDGLRILFNPGKALTTEAQNIIQHFWPELKILDVPYDVSDDEVLGKIFGVAPYLRDQLEKNTQKETGLPQTSSLPEAILASGGQVTVHGNQQLVETLTGILGVSYSKNVEISFPYAGVQIASRANWIESGNGKPILVDFGSFYGDAVQALDKAGFVVIQILDTDSIRQAVPPLLNAMGISFAMDSEIQLSDRSSRKVPGIWIHRESLPALILTDERLDPQVIQAIQEKGIILVAEKRVPGEK